jgi:pre-mRNA-splicing factor CWC26
MEAPSSSRRTAAPQGETVHRTKHGRKRDTEAERIEHEEREAERKRDEEKLKLLGSGLTQLHKKDRLEKRLKSEKTSAFSNYVDDDALNAKQKDQFRWGDPMATFKPQVKQAPSAPPNRFSIAPGRRWDGIPRSNGFEASYFQNEHQHKILQDEFQKWSTEDM